MLFIFLMKNLKKIKIFNNFIQCIFNIICPQCCLFCGEKIILKNNKTQESQNLQKFLCQNCQNEIIPIDQANCCKKCGYPLYQSPLYQQDENIEINSNFLNKKYNLCYSCELAKNCFTIARSCFQYKTKLRRLLINFKLYFQTESIDFIGLSLLKVYSSMPHADIVCCIPVTKTKLFFKGYNHASLIASNFYEHLTNQKRTNKRTTIFLPDMLLKTRSSVQSKMLSQKERLQKKHNFVINSKYLSNEWRQFFSKKTILIIDDIMTTGATLNTAASVIKASFGKDIKIECLTLARTMLY